MTAKNLEEAFSQELWSLKNNRSGYVNNQDIIEHMNLQIHTIQDLAQRASEKLDEFSDRGLFKGHLYDGVNGDEGFLKIIEGRMVEVVQLIEERSKVFEARQSKDELG